MRHWLGTLSMSYQCRDLTVCQSLWIDRLGLLTSDFECLARLRLDPFAVDERLIVQ
jgi:hypothetical protein